MKDDQQSPGTYPEPEPELAQAKQYPPEHAPPPVIAVPTPSRGPKKVSVSFGPKAGPATPDEALWLEIQQRGQALSFPEYSAFIDGLLCDASFTPAPGVQAQAQVQTQGPRTGFSVTPYRNDLGEKLQAGLRSHLYGPDAYLLLQVATELFLMHNACIPLQDSENFPQDIDPQYLVRVNSSGRALPYLKLIRDRLIGTPVGNEGTLNLGSGCHAIPHSRLFEPCFLELIWSYWHEQGMLVQTIGAIALRFQNIRRGRGRDPLAGLELDPLRPLNNLLWGYLQEEHRRLSLVRRAYEYDHHYGLRIAGRAVPEMRPADSRMKFLPAFHELLYQAHVFYKDDDIATVQADPFPVLNALRELHFILAEGMHNQFGDLPSQARGEMLIQQWLLARPELREFLRGRIMVPYPEPWMDCVDTMKTLQGWTDVPVLYFNELAVTGEQLLLSVRYADWATQTPTSTTSAANWARAFRSVVQRYLYAYRLVTGVDLAVDRVEIQSPQLRDGQPPIRVRVRSARRATQRAIGDVGSMAQLPPAGPQAIPGVTGVPVPTRAIDRSGRR